MSSSESIATLPFPNLLALRRQRFTELVEIDQIIKARLHAECGGALFPPIVAAPSGDLFDLEATRAIAPTPAEDSLRGGLQALPPAPARRPSPRTSKATNRQAASTRGNPVLEILQSDAARAWTLDEITDGAGLSRANTKGALFRLCKSGQAQRCGSSLYRVTKGSGTSKPKPKPSLPSSTRGAKERASPEQGMTARITELLHRTPDRVFTPAEVAERVGCGLKQAQNGLFHAQRANKIAKLGRGEYRGTPA